MTSRSKGLPKATAALLTSLAMIGRLLPHLPNFTPLSGATLFASSKINRPWNYLLPLATLFVTDLFLGFYNMMPYVYGSFLLIAILGERTLKKNPSLWRVAGISLVSSALFYVISNFGVWQAGGLYPHTIAGLTECYVLALPFLRNTVLGDLTFSVGFFAAYQWAEKHAYTQSLDKTVVGWLS